MMDVNGTNAELTKVIDRRTQKSCAFHPFHDTRNLKVIT